MWVVTHDVVAGQPFTVEDVQLVQVHAASGDFNYEVDGPAAFHALFARSLQINDILRSDDLIPVSAESEVAVTVEGAPALATGDTIDVFAAVTSDQQVLIGHDLVVNSVSGGAITLLVPVADEASWIAISASSLSLHVALTCAAQPVEGSPEAPQRRDPPRCMYHSRRADLDFLGYQPCVVAGGKSLSRARRLRYGGWHHR